VIIDYMRCFERTAQDFHPEGATVYIYRHGDEKIATDALRLAERGGDERATDILKPNEDKSYRDTQAGFSFESYETPYVVSALAKYALYNLERRPRLTKHTEELIGSLVVTASNEFNKS
jgi:hypothetical protein